MIKLTKQQVLNLYKQLIDTTGGISGVRGENMLISALETPFQSYEGQELYPSIQAKAVRLNMKNF